MDLDLSDVKLTSQALCFLHFYNYNFFFNKCNACDDNYVYT